MRTLRKLLHDNSPAGLVIAVTIAAALAIFKAMLAVGMVSNNAWHGHPQMFACNGCPEPPCPSPFPGICEDS